jgi:tetratricopeptide (TPR) repeat protein
MTERVAAGAPATNFCSQCGARLPTDARFCAGCGCPVVASAVRPQPDVVPSPPAHARRSLREQAPGLVVLTMFLAIGLALWVSVLRPGAPASSAPTRQPAPQTAAAGMPADHPPTTLPDEAKKFIASLLEKAQAAPADVSAWKTLAQVQSRAAEIDASYAPAAVDSYKHVLGIAPEDTDALRGLGNVYYDQQQFAAAAEQYEGYLRLKPDDASVRTDLATTYLYQRQLDRAVDTYKKVIATNPSFLQAHFNLGLAYEALGSRDKALESLATARTLAPDDATREQIDRVTAQLKGGGGARLAGGPPPTAVHNQPRVPPHRRRSGAVLHLRPAIHRMRARDPGPPARRAPRRPRPTFMAPSKPVSARIRFSAPRSPRSSGPRHKTPASRSPTSPCRQCRSSPGTCFAHGLKPFSTTPRRGFPPPARAASRSWTPRAAQAWSVSRTEPPHGRRLLGLSCALTIGDVVHAHAVLLADRG